jgi:hypothetical protein
MMDFNGRSPTSTIFSALVPRMFRSASSHKARNALGLNACVFSIISSGGSSDAACWSANTRIIPSSSFGELCSKT